MEHDTTTVQTNQHDSGHESKLTSQLSMHLLAIMLLATGIMSINHQVAMVEHHNWSQKAYRSQYR